MFKTIFDLRRPCGPNEALRTPVGKNRVFFGQKFLEAVPMCANTFWWGARSKKGRKGHTCVGKVVRPRSDT